jgi:predicted GIY-YIG superfamily endonuclease
LDTLVSTEDGLRQIGEIQAGDYVWSENTETGKKELKKVLSVSVTETTTLVHVTTENGTVINTTENHPFYVEGKGWCAAAELETGDVLRTEDGEQETVKSVQTEKRDKAVKVYNLEIEDSHTYYVSADSVLVHNVCGEVPDSLMEGEADTDVYFGVKDGDKVYVGISKNVPARENQHGERFDYLSKITKQKLTRRQARAIEQVLIELNRGKFQNLINSISSERDWYDEAKSWGFSWLENMDII